MIKTEIAKTFCFRKLFILGYNTLDGHYSGLKQIRLGIVLAKWWIQFNLLVYSIRIGITDRG